jgi:NAD+--asparagine ADP-ribosyltransferase
MAKKVMTVESEIKRQLKFSIKRDGRAEGGYYATLCKFRNEIGGTFDEFLKKYPIYTWYKENEHYNKK